MTKELLSSSLANTWYEAGTRSQYCASQGAKDVTQHRTSAYVPLERLERLAPEGSAKDHNKSIAYSMMSSFVKEH